jgi:hypothetical protein
MTSNPKEQFEARVKRLQEERSYSQPGWHVPVRQVRTERLTLRLCLKEWLMYPLFSARV